MQALQFERKLSTWEGISIIKMINPILSQTNMPKVLRLQSMNQKSSSFEFPKKKKKTCEFIRILNLYRLF